MKYILIGFNLTLLSYGLPVDAQEICPQGESMATRLIVTQPSRLENIYKMPDTDANGFVTSRVFENDEWMVTPPEYKWIDKPENYIAPQTIINRDIKDMSGRIVCFKTYERRMFHGVDHLTLANGTTQRSSAQFQGAPTFANICDTLPKMDPVTVETEIAYDPKFWETDNTLRIVLKPSEMKIRQIPKVMQSREAVPKLVGQIYHPAKLKELSPICRVQPRAKPDSKMAEVPVMSWSVVYLKGYEKKLGEVSKGLERIGASYDLSQAVLTTSIDPKSLDVVWHVFDACNPVGNHGLNKMGEPKLDASGNREWAGKSVLQQACGDLFKQPSTGKVLEKISGRGLAEKIFKRDIGPNKAYHLVDLSLGVMVWYDEGGDEIARFKRIF